MRTKTDFVLYIIIVLTVMIVIIGCIYKEQEVKKQVSNIENDVEDKIIIEVKKVETETDKEVDKKAVEPISLGKFKLTAYCPCSKCCGEWANNRPDGIVYGAIGEELRENYSIAVDPNVIPYRTEVIINNKIYKAQDCGGGIKGNEIDIYFDNHDDALEFGVQYEEVLIKR